MPHPTLNQSAQRPVGRPDERGATLVEFALVLPVFLLLVFGMIEFSWYFAQSNEVRHIAETTAHNASRADGTASSGNICSQRNLTRGDALTYTFSSAQPTSDRSWTAEVTVKMDNGYNSLTGFIELIGGWPSISATAPIFYASEEQGTPTPPVWEGDQCSS